MRNISNAFRRMLYENHRNYGCIASIVLADNTELTITNVQIWQNGLSLEDNVSDENSFTALGSAIINSITLVINNIYDTYSSYDFTDALVTVSVGLYIGATNELIKLGTMKVEEAQYNGSLISLHCLDNMTKFDMPYSNSSLTYPASLQDIITNACIDCGVQLKSTTFPNNSLVINDRPEDSAITYREIVSYVATIAGCFARCDADGKLELNWFNTQALINALNTIDGGIFDSNSPYSTGANINGGAFNPWNVGDVADGGLFTDTNSVHYLTALSEEDISVDDVVITGIKIITNTATDGEVTTVEHLYGTDGYIIKVDNNPFITESNVNVIGNYLGTRLIGLTFRKATILHLNDPSIEAGDVALVWDKKRNVYPILITNTTFNVSSYQRTLSSADTPQRNSAVRYTEITKGFVAAKQLIKQEKVLREQLGQALTNALNAKAGMYETHVQESGGGYTYYLHDKPNLNDSAAVIKVTNEAVGVTPNYQATPPTWYGLTVDGNFIANIMSVIGIDFNWGTGGSLVLGGQNNTNGTLTMKDAGNQTIGYWNNDGINAQIGQIGPWTIATNGIRYNTEQSTKHALVYKDGIEFYDGSGYCSIWGSNNTPYHAYFGDTQNNEHVWINSSTGNSSNVYTNINAGEISLAKPTSTQMMNLVNAVIHDYNASTYYGALTLSKLSGSTLVDTISLGGYDGTITASGTITAKKFHIDAGEVAPIIENVYNSITYPLIRNHNNGNISVSASGVGLYLGWENTTGVYSPLVRNTTTSAAANVNIDPNGKLSCSTSSSKRYKHDIKPLEDFRKVLDIPVVSFIYNEDYVSETDIRFGKAIPGFIAEDIFECYPIAAELKDGKPEDWNPRYIIPPMLAVVQEHEKKITALEKENEKLRAEIDELKIMIYNLKKE